MKIAAALIAILATVRFDLAYAQSTAQPFVVAQLMHYKDADADLAAHGIIDIPILGESTVVPSKERDDPVQGAALEALAAKMKPGLLPTVIDIERWTIYTKDKAARAENLEKYLHVIDGLRKARPDIKFGFYGVLPNRVYFPLVDPKQRAEKHDWETFNRMAQGDLAQHVDALFPSLYTFYEDEKGWETYARETLLAARQFKKPVYAFLWPQYESDKLKGQYLPAKYWKLELETCRKYCDGIVIWDEPKKPWDPEAPWWKETVAFLDKLKKKEL